MTFTPKIYEWYIYIYTHVFPEGHPISYRFNIGRKPMISSFLMGEGTQWWFLLPQNALHPLTCAVAKLSPAALMSATALVWRAGAGGRTTHMTRFCGLSFIPTTKPIEHWFDIYCVYNCIYVYTWYISCFLSALEMSPPRSWREFLKQRLHCVIHHSPHHVRFVSQFSALFSSYLASKKNSPFRLANSCAAS